MQFEFEGKCVLKLEHKEGEKTSKHVKTDFNLSVSKGLDVKQYLDKDELPTAMGVKALTQCFVQGLVGNIHYAKEKGFWDDAEHLRYIISELERGFIQVPTLSKSEFDSDSQQEIKNA
jgi:hypothetical protein